MTLTDTENWEEQYAHSLGIQAYIYGFPWIYLSWLKWLWTTEGGKALAEKEGLNLPWAPVNTFFYGKGLATPASATGGSPNCDTIYSTAWLDVSREPMIVSVPEVDDRYYCRDFACIDSDNFAYIGNYATGTKAANYLIGGPGWNGDVPDDVNDILPRSRTPEILVMARTGVNESSSLNEVNKALAIQAQYQLTPLSKWINSEAPDLEIKIDPHFPVNPTTSTTGAWIAMNRSMTKNPPGVLPGVDQSELLTLFATVGVGPNQSLLSQSPATLAGLKLAAEQGFPMLKTMGSGTGTTLNEWSYPPRDIGTAGQNGDFITRAALQALAGIVAHDPDEGVYIHTSLDSQGNPLSSESDYTMTFGKAAFPSYNSSLHGFWSITIYQSSDNNLPQGSHAYTINSYDIKYKRRDANRGMTIYLQRDRPVNYDDGKDGIYWLQPPETAGFYLILRVYIPGPDIWNTQTYAPPAIEKQ